MMLIDAPMTDRAPRRTPPTRGGEPPDPLLSDEPTIELVIRARGGDRFAVEALLQRCLPSLTRWAHGRLPTAARGAIDTGDLVQDAVLHALQRLDTFEPRHVGAMQAYLRQSVINRIRDEVRRVVRRPGLAPIAEELPSDATSPLEFAIQTESYARYRHALEALKPREREMIVARVEVQWTVAEIAQRFRLPSVDAARMAVSRALKRLSAHMRPDKES